jgi:uncharacterized repeat protein (TIGR01451 family)
MKIKILIMLLLCISYSCSNEESIESNGTPSLSLIKNASLNLGNDGILNAGDVIEYTLTITNTGNVTVSDITINDPLTGTVDMGIEPNELLPDDSVITTLAYTINQTDLDIGYVENSAVVRGERLGGNPNDDSDDVTDTSDSGTDRYGNLIDNPESIDSDDNPATNIDEDVTVMETYLSYPQTLIQTEILNGYCVQHGHFSLCDNIFEYTNDHLSYWVKYTFNSAHQIAVTEDNGLITNYFELVNASPGVVYSLEYDFVYDINENIVQIEYELIDGDGVLHSDLYTLNYQGNMILFSNQNNTFDYQIIMNDSGEFFEISNSQYVWTLTYSGGNMVSVERDDNRWVSFEYDQKSNPYKNGIFMNMKEIESLLLVLNEDFNHLQDYYNIFYNANNIVKKNIHTSLNPETISYSFIYNSNGHPIEKTRQDSDYTLIYTYE